MGRGGSASGQHQMVVDPDRPRFHVHPPQGWMNDPNGPVFYRGRYHMFYQHLPNACEWAFGIVWGHAVSEDLVHWQHLPPALEPSPGSPDADGCFSGSCVLDSDGTPVLLYTGVRLRSNLEAGPLPPPEHDLGMVWIETQMAAVPEDPDDELLTRWRKVDPPFLHLPPSDLQLTGWRDPFIFTTNTAAAPTADGGFTAHGYSQEIRMLIGSGLKGQGGTALVYKSTSLLSGWELEGTLCEASNTDTGVVWECPLLVPLDPVPRTLRAPTKQAPPLWLICPPEGSGSEGGSEDGSAFGSFTRPAGLDNSKRSPTPDLPYGPFAASLGSAAAPLAAAVGAAKQAGAQLAAALQGSGASSSEAATAAAEILNAAAAAAAAPPGSEGAQPAPEALALVALHARSNSFAFDQDLSADDATLAAEAAAALQAWQQQASGSATGSAAASPREEAVAAAEAPAAVAAAAPAAPPPAADAAAAEAPAAAAPAAAAPAAPPPAAAAAAPDAAALAAAAAPIAAALPAALEMPSNAAALPPGRKRQPVADAQIDLGTAASLAHWSHPPSEQQSPESSALGSPQASPPKPASQQSSPQRPPLQPRRGRPPALQLPGAAAAEQRTRHRSSRRGSMDRLQDAQQAQHVQQQHEEEEDRFAAAFSRLSMRGIRARKRSAEPSSRRGSQAALAQLAGLWGGEEDEGASTPPAPSRQWHFFTVSPDAPTNPVLYWIGHVDDSGMPRFELEGAKGPYRLDLGDVLYAPNVCQDGQGRWLMWGWLQERRKVGSYSYAGCLTLPRVLRCTEDGRLVQAPIPELSQLRQGPGWHQHSVHVPAESTVPLAAAPGCAALDIELTLDRGTAFAAGLLFRSHEAEAEGGTALIYDWERNSLEAIFNVPPNWQPPAAPHTAKFSGSAADGSEAFDPALLLTPRPSELMLVQGPGFSRTPSVLFSPDAGFGFESQTGSAAATPRTATESLGGEASSALLSPQRSGITIAGAAPRPPSLDLGIPGLPLPPHLAGDAAGQGGSMLAGAGLAAAAFSSSLPRSLGGLGGFGGPASLPTGGLHRSVSDVRTLTGGMTRVGSQPALQSYASSLPRLGSLAAPPSPGSRSQQLPQLPGVDTDADLDFLLDELAAPMREAPPPIVEPRRVGGPLPTMRANAPLHLRILVDHSCVEVYTGTGETLSTRIYRGQAPEGATDAGISFLAFGGTALVRRCSSYEMGSAWEHPSVAAAASPKVAARVAPSPNQAAVPAAVAASAGSRGSSAAASPAAKAGNGKEPVWLESAGADGEAGGQRGAKPAAATAAAAAADALLDEMVMLSPQCSATVVGAFA